MTTALADILVSAVAVIRDRRVLMVTARGREVLFMPGGKVDAGETPSEAAAREAFEEVALTLDAAALALLFTVVTQAHGEPDGRLVRMDVFAAATDDEPHPSGEVSAVHWVDTTSLDHCPPAGREVLERLAVLGLID